MEEKVEENPKQEQTISADKSDTSNETKNSYKKYVLQASDIAQFPEVPDWKPEEMEE